MHAATTDDAHRSSLSVLDDGLSLAASMLPMREDVIQRFINDVIVEEFNQSNRPLQANSIKQFNAIDHQMPAKVQAQIEQSLGEQCDEIVDNLLARFLVESVMMSMQTAF